MKSVCCGDVVDTMLANLIYDSVLLLFIYFLVGLKPRKYFVSLKNWSVFSLLTMRAM